MDGALIVVHRPRGSGGRRVTVRGQIIGLAHCDRDLVEFLRRSGLDETSAEDMVAGNSALIEWRGGRAHHYEAA
ncbi:hypothetical protein [Streptomyces melanogenes]|uniref:hypothetical protein n=1 Tax=Streptomyces melanogenes TaxID=67326 RepID=UPI00167EA983|nr:hypothetical protein [Streptomyces melanogenes]GGP78078.1 hypothetical protein GCM10010278_65580 [Streptomyces melanogenes]